MISMKKYLLIFITVLIVFSIALPAGASLIESSVVRKRSSMSIGFSMLQGPGVVATGNFPIDNKMSLGGSFGFSLETPNPYLMDLYMNLQFIEPSARNPLSMSLVGGIWGGTSDGIWLSKKEREVYVQPELGVTISYMFDSRMTGRLNLVYGPTLGAEIGYKIFPKLEGIFAISAQVIGLKFRVF
jgi:hypothetical protein